MDEEPFDPLGEDAQRERGPSVPPAGSVPPTPLGSPGPPLGSSGAPLGSPGPSLGSPGAPTGSPGTEDGDGLGFSLGPVANDWPVWTGFVALLAALVIAAVAGLIVDIPALVLGVKISQSYTPPGLEFADTVVQDIAFVLTAVMFAQFGGRTVRSWQFGFRPTPARRAAGLATLTILVFLLFSAVWVVVLKVKEEDTKLLEALGTNETALLLALSALLTTVIAPICEETLFRGYIFAALSKWRGWLPAAVLTGILFGGVHYGSAPVVDLVPLAVLGFALCVLYRRTGSLYPCIAVHSLNNSFAFGELEKWGWGIPLLMVGALATIGLVAWTARRVGLISEAPASVAVVSTAYDHP
jgi:membrane protease YdiL (CAAX protease family)